MSAFREIVILTGAGISAESGLPTFRDADGLWEGHRVEDVATPEAFARQPELVHHFYNLRRAALLSVEPNPAHRALARLQREFAGRVTLVTQNIDNLHERGGSPQVLHMHGELLKIRCEACGAILEWDRDLDEATVCPACGRAGGLRPHIVWFGEMPLEMDTIESALARADLFAAIGTSGHVYPAAGFVRQAAMGGAATWEINNAATAASSFFRHRLLGPASEEVPRFVARLLADELG